jgi:electron transport complex protein RnfC
MNTPFELHDFVGGIHPAQNKKQSTSRPICDAGIAEKLILPLAQHIGAQSNPLINVGDTVLKGQLVAESQGFISANLHAPTSGMITAIGDMAIAHMSGLTGPCIELTPDNKDTWVECNGVNDYLKSEPAELINIIKAAGITGMGGAGFPTHVKVSAKPETIKTLILNAAECEPYITSDDMLIQERANDVISGISILAHILKPESILIGIEDNKPKAIEALERALAELSNTSIQVIAIPTKYPSGGEKQLIQILTGKEVPSGGLPSQLGIACQNIGTAYAIHNAVTKGQPLISRITTVTGNACSAPQNYEVLIGTPVEHLLSISDTDLPNTSRLVMGGPMMGFTIDQIQTPIVKASNCIIAATKEELPDPAMEQACIRCGMCTEVCPAQLLPQQLYWFAKSSNLEQAEKHNIADCIECGACSFVCPSNIPLVQYYRFSKGEIKQANADKLKSDRAKVRFETRLARLEQEQVDKDAKRQARAEAAAKKQAEKKAAAAAAPQVSQEANGESTPAPDLKLQLELLQKKFDATIMGVSKSKEKIAALESAEAPNESKIELMKGALDKAQSKMKEAATALAAGKKALKAQTETAGSSSAESKTKPATKSPAEELETLKQKVLGAQTRVDKADERLNMAKEQGLDTIQAFETGLSKQQAKLDDANKALDTFTQSSEEAK